MSTAALSDEMVSRMSQIYISAAARLPFIAPNRGMAMILAWGPVTVSPLGARSLPGLSRESRYRVVLRMLMLASAH